jgi:hypothetical protein
MKRLLPFFMLFMLSGCVSTPDGIGPTDYALEQARADVNAGVEGARPKYAALLREREIADMAANTGSSILNTVIPGSGAALLALYSIWATWKKKQTSNALDLLTNKIEEFPTTKEVKISVAKIADPVIEASVKKIQRSKKRNQAA